MPYQPLTKEEQKAQNIRLEKERRNDWQTNSMGEQHQVGTFYFLFSDLFFSIDLYFRNRAKKNEIPVWLPQSSKRRTGHRSPRDDLDTLRKDLYGLAHVAVWGPLYGMQHVANFFRSILYVLYTDPAQHLRTADTGSRAYDLGDLDDPHE